MYLKKKKSYERSKILNEVYFNQLLAYFQKISLIKIGF